MLTTRSEEIRMMDDKSFDHFYANSKDIGKLSFNLDEKISEVSRFGLL